MLIGGTISSPIAGINLTSAELAQIQPASGGSLTIGEPLQAGTITFKSATPTTTATQLYVMEDTAGTGAIILDDSSGGTALNGSGGTLTLTAGTGGIQTTLYAIGTPLATNGLSASGPLNLSLGFAPTIGTQLTVINNTATPAGSNLVSGAFSNVAQGGTITLSYNATPYYFTANYQGGDGNDLVLTNVAGPATHFILASQPPSTVIAGSGFAFTITAEDSQGNVATGFSDTVTLSDSVGGATFGSITFSGGLATATLDIAGAIDRGHRHIGHDLRQQR